MLITRQPPWLAVVPLLVAMVIPAAAPAGDPLPFTARAGEDLANAAAIAWAEDARLIYLENDEPLNGDGSAERWGYLYWSDARGEARGYSVRGGKIRAAEDLAFDFAAPPLPGPWLDSEKVLAAADEKAGNDFRAKHGGRLRSMLLVRGLLYPEKPDRATWAVVYDSPDAPGLWVVVDAQSGKVVRTWRG